MLLVLAGDIQTGKTRWLEARVAELGARGVTCAGVVAPGVWREGRGRTGGARLVKRGIDNVLLPEGTRLRLARPLAGRDARTGLAWDFDRDALARVNAHFSALRARAAAAAGGSPADARPGLLVVDELGPLELRRGEGLVEALATVSCGPTPLWQNALVVVRRSLADEALARLAPAWEAAALVAPDEDGRHLLEKRLLSTR